MRWKEGYWVWGKTWEKKAILFCWLVKAIALSTVVLLLELQQQVNKNNLRVRSYGLVDFMSGEPFWGRAGTLRACCACSYSVATWLRKEEWCCAHSQNDCFLLPFYLGLWIWDQCGPRDFLGRHADALQHVRFPFHLFLKVSISIKSRGEGNLVPY